MGIKFCVLINFHKKVKKGGKILFSLYMDGAPIVSRKRFAPEKVSYLDACREDFQAK